jgi:diguanylate cyclase (GGDEF)-like protein
VFSGLVRAAREDGLTGVLNYVSLEEALQEEINRSERHGHGLSCCFLDLEDFKSINDNLGHEQGNQVLAAVALVLKRNVRSCDILGRYGGDEFVVVLPETGEDETRIFAERLRDDIAYLTATLLGSPIQAQIGISTWAPGLPSNALMRDAEQAMRAAKTNGDGVVTAVPGASLNGDSEPLARRRSLVRPRSSRSNGSRSNGSGSNGSGSNGSGSNGSRFAQTNGKIAGSSEPHLSTQRRKLQLVRRFLSGRSKAPGNGQGSLARRWRG